MSEEIEEYAETFRTQKPCPLRSAGLGECPDDFDPWVWVVFGAFAVGIGWGLYNYFYGMR